MDNVVSDCYVISFENGNIDPVIYLTRPEECYGRTIHPFTNPFDAKAFIRNNFMQNVVITVQKQEDQQYKLWLNS